MSRSRRWRRIFLDAISYPGQFVLGLMDKRICEYVRRPASTNLG